MVCLVLIDIIRIPYVKETPSLDIWEDIPEKLMSN